MDSRIVIINIGNADREEIAYVIDKAASMQPKVIALDAFFVEPMDPAKDSILRSAIAKTPDLIGVSRLFVNDDNYHVAKEYFDSSFSKRGYANLVGDTIGTVRSFAPFEKVDNKRYPQIASAIVKDYDPNAYRILEQRHKEIETINYSRRTNQYMIVEKEKLLFDEVDKNLLKGKIVLLGYVNTDPNNIEDKKFTPMNTRFAGKSVPDMNGVIVQANIVSMILDGKYIKMIPGWVAWLVAFLVGWAHMSLFIRYYLDNHIWFHLVAKLAQVFSAILFAYLGIFIFDQFRIKLDMKYTLYVIVLAVDIIYFYEAFAVWLNKKTGFKTVFRHHHPEHH